MRKSLAFAVFGTMAAITIFVGPPVKAAPKPKLTGGVALETTSSDYTPQFAEFNVTDGSPDSGSVTYTNFAVSEPGTGIFNVTPIKAIALDHANPDAPDFTLAVIVDPNSIVATSPTSYEFSASASDQINEYTVNGAVTNGTSVSFDVFDDGVVVAHAEGTIGSGGTAEGTGSSTNFGTFTWETTDGSAFEVFHYTAPVNCVTISGDKAAVNYTIPNSTTHVLWIVEDGGAPGRTKDKAGFTVPDNISCPGAPLGSAPANETIVSGNLKVH